MVQAGKATDATIEQLLPHLDQGDIIIDGGNAYFPDTVRRSKELEEKVSALSVLEFLVVKKVLLKVLRLCQVVKKVRINL